MMTPYDKLKPLPDAAHSLTPGVTFQTLDEIARQCSDNDAAPRLNQARAELFQLIPTKRRLSNASLNLLQAHLWIGKD